MLPYIVEPFAFLCFFGVFPIDRKNSESRIVDFLALQDRKSVKSPFCILPGCRFSASSRYSVIPENLPHKPDARTEIFRPEPAEESYPAFLSALFPSASLDF
jgi:hypothetical protein